MKVICKKRGKVKTYDAIQYCSENGHVLVVSSQILAKNISYSVKQRGIEVDVISYGELMHGKRAGMVKEFFIDDIEVFIDRSGLIKNIVGFTCDIPEEDE